jgi:hypothetical protein
MMDLYQALVQKLKPRIDEFCSGVEGIENAYSIFGEKIMNENDEIFYCFSTYYFYLHNIEKHWSSLPEGMRNLTCQASQNLIGISSCLKSGALKPSLELLRSLLEVTLNLKYISRDVIHRDVLYVQYTTYAKYKAMRKDLYRPSSRRIERELTRDYNRIKSGYVH